MKSELLKNFSSIKIFLFDLEGVLISKHSAVDYTTVKPDWSFIKTACEEFSKLGARFGVVTAADIKHDFDNTAVDGCIFLTASINKVEKVNELLSRLQIDYKDVFYIGDDLLDIPLLQKCGISAAPKDGRREVKRIVSFITQSDSGQVLNEIIDYLKQSKSGN